MRKPWWRARDAHWYIVNSRGKQQKLGHDPAGATRKHPPADVLDAWHRLARIGDYKDIFYPEIAELYTKSMKNPKTAEGTKWFLDGFVKYIGQIKVSELRVHHISAYLKSKTTWNSTTQADCLERITSSLSFAVKEGYVETHHVRYSRGQRPRRKKRIVIVQDDHAALMEANANPNLSRLLKTFRLTGCRPNELCTAIIERLDFKNGIMLVLNKTREKTGQEFRPVYMNKAVQKLVREAIGKRKAGPVFLNTREGAYNPRELAKQVRMLRIKLKLPNSVFPYAYRHRFGSHQLNRAKMNPAHVATLMGHVGLEQLRVYYHPEHEVLREEVEKISE